MGWTGGELGRQRLLEEAVAVEDVGEGTGVDRLEAARQIGDGAHDRRIGAR
jgi:hypothetical protein